MVPFTAAIVRSRVGAAAPPAAGKTAPEVCGPYPVKLPPTYVTPSASVAWAFTGPLSPSNTFCVPTVIDCADPVAGSVALAVSVHVPAARNVTTPLATEHTLVVDDDTDAVPVKVPE
ncbi:unannotated protein [freshwater metagenome]|uniref:Unannotated protein n=1 Tax=freshwater metagenome TaxID=449393 RepID=A0A6J7Q0I5_9ZZZZ